MDRPGNHGSLRRLARRLKSLAGPRVVVLLYHRIGEPGIDPHRLCVTPGHFAEQMDVLKRFGPVLRLAELSAALEAGKLPRRASVVTFDDGYVDNLESAKPILEAGGVPATVFATTGNIGRAREFWWDELERVVLGSGPLPNHLQVDINGTPHSFGLNANANDAGEVGLNRQWDFDRPTVPEPVGSRRWLYREVSHRIWDLADAARQAVLDQLIAQAGQSAVVRPAYRAMDDDELSEMDHGGLVEVGAHTQTHPNLAAQSADVQREEIVRSRSRLRDVLGREVESFAYPFGLHTPESVRLVREAGFKRACICNGHAVRRSSEAFRLTRIDLGDVGGDEFTRLLRDCVAW